VFGELARKIVEWRARPEVFAREMLGVDLWSKQVEILRALRSHRRVAVPSCHASGKTKVAAVAVIHQIVCYQPSKVITTAPTQRAVETLLWGEINAMHAAMERRLGGTLDLGRVYGMSWKIEPDWFALGFATTADKGSDNATKFQGYHSPNMLTVIDEADGIDRAVWNAIDGLLTESTSRVLAIANPVNVGTDFERNCKSKNWRVIRISAFDCPNLQPGATGAGWGVERSFVDDMREKWGEDSPVYQSRVLGLFPTSSVDTLISIADVERAIAAIAPEPVADDLPAIGCDVARFGTDETVIYVVRRGCVLHAESWAGQDTMKTAGRLIALARESGLWLDSAWRIAVDDTGLGGGVVDRLHEQGWGVDAVNFGSSPRDWRNEERFTNRRMELWWGLREWLRGGASLAGLDADTLDILRSDLCAPKYEQKSDGRIALEPKEKIKDRIGRSPDHGDALALAVSVLSAPAPLVEEPKPPPDDEPEDSEDHDWRAETLVRVPPVW